MEPINISTHSFDTTVTKASQPVLIDFWASWCMPCRMLSPVVDEIAQAYDGKLTVGKVNVDEEPSLAQTYGVMSIPTLILFVKGEVKEKLVGVLPKEDIVAAIEKHL